MNKSDVMSPYIGNFVPDPPIVYTYELAQNYPNPFSGITTIRFTLPNPGNVELSIFDSLGRRIVELANRTFTEGPHEIVFDASTLPAGIYLYQLISDGQTESRKLIVLK